MHLLGHNAGGVRGLTALVCCVLLGLVCALPAAAQQRVVLQLRWEPQFQFAGYYAALWQGYYAEAGLDVEIRPGVTPERELLSAVEEVTAGRADFGIGAADVLVARDMGAPLVIATSIFQQSSVAVFSREAARVDSPAELTRLRVRRAPNKLIEVELYAMLLAEGISPDQVAHVDIPGWEGRSTDLLHQDVIDAYTGYTLTALWHADQLRMPLSVMRPSTYGIDFYGDALFTTETLARKHPALVRRFVHASLQGWRYALENAYGTAERIARELPRTLAVDDKLAFNLFQIPEVHRLTLYPVVPLGNTNPQRWLRMHETLRQVGLVSGKADLEAMVFDPDREAARRRELQFEVAVGALAVGAVLIVAFLAWNATLRRQVSYRTRQLDAGNRRYEHILESMHEGLAVLDREGRITYVNPALRAMMGLTEEDMVGHRPEELGLFDEANLAILKREREYRAAHGPRGYELTHRRRDGRLVLAHVSPNPIYDEHGEMQGRLTVITDITARKQAERALQESEERFRAVAEATPMPILVLDQDDHRVSYANRAATRFFTPLGEPLLGRTASQLWSNLQGPNPLSMLGRTIPLEGFESRIRLSTGDERWIAGMVEPMVFDGQPSALLGLMDITARKDTDKLKDEFVSVVSHELRTPLTSIKGSLGLLVGLHGSRLPEDARRILDIGQRNVEHLLRLINDLLDVQRIESGNLLLRTRRISLAEMLEQAVERNQGYADSFGIRVELTSPAPEITVLGDRDRLIQVMSNLLSNAVKFSPAGGRVRVDVQVREGTARVRVIDEGKGVPPQHRHRMFTKFAQADESDSRQLGGSGLGLSIAKAIIEAHQGTIGYDTVLDIGSTFYFDLPLAPSGSDASTG